MSILANQSILITGGTGSFGRHFIPFLLKKYPDIAKIIVFSRDEHKHHNLRNQWQNEKQIKFVLGDVRDYNSVYEAFRGVDYVIHTAALKHIHIAEENPLECIRTNILGSENVARAAKERGIEKVVAISTDKASSPSSVYGASKLCADKLFLAANSSDTKFVVVRYANVFGSAGSVVPFFLQKAKQGVIPITHPGMTRFSITAEEASKLVEYALLYAMGGEILIPKLPAFKVLDLAKAICPSCKIEYVGIRAGEKIYEEMLSSTDALFTIETEKMYIVTKEENQEIYLKHYKAEKVAENFVYSSDKAQDFLNLAALKEKLQNYQTENSGVA
ncbi:MAG: UDP-N-acetylglucosamine 4,6-dehydratase (inverting) [Raineya sp.]